MNPTVRERVPIPAPRSVHDCMRGVNERDPRDARNDAAPPVRTRAFGERYRLTWVDRLGIWLSARQVRRWASELAGRVVMDIGCGFEASLARTMLPEAARVFLSDVQLAPDLATHPKVVPLVGSLPDTLAEVEAGTVDLALCLSVLEHLADPDAVLCEIHRLLRPGGLALVNVPSWRGKYFLELSAFRLGLSPIAEMDDHKRYFDVRDLWPRLVAAGFRPSRIRCFSHKWGLNTFAACRKEPAQ
jgi:SAM-dependent methyltransferase